MSHRTGDYGWLACLIFDGTLGPTASTIPRSVLDRRAADEERAAGDDAFSAIRSIGALLEEMKAQMAAEIARAETAARKERDRADRLQDENDDLVAALAESRASEQQAGSELRDLRGAIKTLFAVANCD